MLINTTQLSNIWAAQYEYWQYWHHGADMWLQTGEIPPTCQRLPFPPHFGQAGPKR